MPHFNGLPASPFLARMAVFGPTLGESMRNALADPAQVARWLWQPDIRAYLGGLLATGGYASLFSPPILLLTAPVLALNVFSTWSWSYSEGAHYSASLIPFVIASAIYGVGNLARRIGRQRAALRPPGSIALSAIVLGISGYHHWEIGMTPLGRNFRGRVSRRITGWPPSSSP